MIKLNEFETEEVLKETIQPTPNYHCGSCGRLCTDKTCSFYNRRVESNNRCFNHTAYGMADINAVFKPIPDEVMSKFIEESEAA